MNFLIRFAFEAFVNDLNLYLEVFLKIIKIERIIDLAYI